MNQQPAALARLNQGLRISFAQARQQGLERSPALTRLARDRALWACVAVIGLSLLSAYVVVLRDAVRNGEVVRTGLAQQGRMPGQARVKPAPPADDSWLAAAPMPR